MSSHCGVQRLHGGILTRNLRHLYKAAFKLFNPPGMASGVPGEPLWRLLPALIERAGITTRELGRRMHRAMPSQSPADWTRTIHRLKMRPTDKNADLMAAALRIPKRSLLGEDWDVVLLEALDQRGMSVDDLAERVHELDPKKRPAKRWKENTLKFYVYPPPLAEDTAREMARILRVPRATLIRPQRRALQDQEIGRLRAEVSRLQAKVRRLEKRLGGG